MNSAADIWLKVLPLLEQELTPTAVSTWFDDAQAVELDGSRFVLYIPTSFKKEIIQAKYVKAIQSALYQIVNTRLLERRSTILSTNLMPDDIARRHSPQTASRIEGEYQLLPFVGEDVRKLKKNRC